MNSEPGQRQDTAAGGAFNLYLRTGRRLEAGLARGPLQLKYNHYHDRENGQFTTAGSGQYFAGGGGSFGGAGATGTGVWGKGPSRFAPEHPRNLSIYVVKKGDTLNKIAAQRKGLRASDLAELNRIKNPNLLHVGQQLKLPHQSYLEAGRAAKNNMLAIVNYQDTHGGKLPPNVAKAPPLKVQVAASRPARTIKANGYSFHIDEANRTVGASGLIVRNSEQGRNQPNQDNAGKPDRRGDDHGGHYIARRFNGPTAAFNHFAQNKNFNQSAYAKLENFWDRETKKGKRVFVDIRPEYLGDSKRPYRIFVGYRIGSGRMVGRYWPNESGKKKK